MSQPDAAPVMVAVAPNGARKTRSDHPRLPITPSELAQCAADCVAAGASLMHLHVRDPDGRHSLEPADYRAALGAIRARVGDALILQVTSESGGRYGPRQQMACIDALAAEAVSLAVREVFAGNSDANEAGAFLHRLRERATLIQYIVYNTEDVRRCVQLHAAGTIPGDAPHLLFVLGSYAEQRAGHPAELLDMLTPLPPRWPWSVCAFGAAELRCVVAAALLGGHVRVGFENNTQSLTGEIAADNAQLVGAAAAALASLGLRCASASQARHLFRDQAELSTATP